MDENKKLKEEIEKNYNILATRYDDEKRCEKLGKFLHSFVTLNDDDDDEENIEFSEITFVNWFRMEKKKEMIYKDVKEEDVIRLFEKLPKVKKK